MRQVIYLLALSMMLPLLSCGQTTNKKDMNKKTLVAYFSCTGNTRQLAQKLSEVVGGDMFEIRPETPYSAADLDWTNAESRSSIEMKDKSSRPAIAAKLPDMDDYDVVFVGFPIWWYVAPTIVNTFLESYDFSGKTVIPFCTSGSSAEGETDKYLHPSCSPQTSWHPTKRFAATTDKKALKDWVDGLNL